jgi:hypothetical protein
MTNVLLNSLSVDSLTAQPEVTLFREALRRHTKFASEVQEISFNTPPDFGVEGSAYIRQSGSLLTNLYLEITLPPLANNGSNGGIYTKNGESTYIPDSNSSYLNWVNAIGFAIINEVSLVINGATIDKHSGLFLEIFNELTDKNKKEWDLVKKYEDRSQLKKVNYEKTTVIVPLKFYFCNNKSQGLPLSELNSGSVQIKVTFNSLPSLINNSESPSISGSGNISSVKLFGEFITLDTAELNTLRTSEKIYTIPVIQYIENVGSGINGNYNVPSSDLAFNGTIKELIWVFRHKNRILTTNPQIINSQDSIFGNDQFNFSNTHTNTTFGDFEIFNTLSISIRNTDIINEDSKYFGDFSRSKYHSSGTKKNIYVYSFALYPETLQPSGEFSLHINNDNISFTFTGVPGHENTTFNNGESGVHNTASSSHYQLSLFAVSYKQLIISNQQATLQELPFSNVATATTPQ